MTRLSAGQIATFKIYPEPKPSRLYYQVRVFASIRVMRRYLRHTQPSRTLGRRGVAMCSSFAVLRLSGNRMRRTPCCGEIVFPLRRLRAGVIAHECAHAALGWARRIGLLVHTEITGRMVSPEEERFCSALGELNRQVAVEVWDRGLQG